MRRLRRRSSRCSGRIAGWEEIRSLAREECGSRPEAVCDLVEAAAEEAAEIGDHLASNWSDAATARSWYSLARSLDKMAAMCRKRLPF